MNRFFCFLPFMVCALFALHPSPAHPQGRNIPPPLPSNQSPPDRGPASAQGALDTGRGQGLDVAHMDDFHPEKEAEKVPFPEITVSEGEALTLAVVPFEAAPRTSKEQETYALYPLGAPKRKRWKNSEPDNPVNNVAPAGQEKAPTLAAPEIHVAPPKSAPQPLFGAPPS